MLLNEGLIEFRLDNNISLLVFGVFDDHLHHISHAGNLLVSVRSSQL